MFSIYDTNSLKLYMYYFLQNKHIIPNFNFLKLY